jgi:hypothetical protein
MDPSLWRPAHDYALDPLLALGGDGTILIANDATVAVVMLAPFQANCGGALCELHAHPYARCPRAGLRERERVAAADGGYLSNYNGTRISSHCGVGEKCSAMNRRSAIGQAAHWNAVSRNLLGSRHSRMNLKYKLKSRSLASPNNTN